jgi:type IV secretory pathway VirB2 component (pilin)
MLSIYFVLLSFALLSIIVADNGPGYSGPTAAPAAGSISSTMLWIIIGVIGGVTAIAVVIVAAILCRRWMRSKQDIRQHRLISL